MNEIHSDGATLSRRWLLGAAVASTASALVYKAATAGFSGSLSPASPSEPTNKSGLGTLSLSVPLHYGQAGSATILNTTAYSMITGTIPGMTLDSQTRILSGTPTVRSFLLRETSGGDSRDTLLFVPKTGQHRMRAGMGVAGINYYTPNNVFLDYMKYAGELTPPLTKSVNGMPLSLGIDGNGNRGAGYIMTLDSLDDKPSNFHIITDGDMDFAGHVKQDGDWIKQQPAGQNTYILNITAIRRAPTYMRYVREDEVANVKAGGVFKKTFLQEMSHFSHIRYMNWHGGNFPEPCNITEDHLLYNDTYQVPLSVIAKSCKQSTTNIYINVHHKTTLESFISDYIPVLDDLIESGCQVYVEHSNEVWNSMFQQCTYAGTAASQMGYRGNSYSGSTWWNGYRTALLAKASRGRGYRWLIGVQTVQQQALAPLMIEGMNQVAGRLDSDIWGYHVSTYASGTLTLSVQGQLGAQQDLWVATGNYDAAFDNVLSNKDAISGGESYSIDNAALTHWPQAKQIADAHGWKLVGYEGNFHLNAVPYSRNPSAYAPFFQRMIEHPLAKPATNYCLETAENAGFEFVTMFDWDSEPGNSDNGRFGMFRHPGYDAVVAWNANLAPGTAGGALPVPAPAFQLSELGTLREHFTSKFGTTIGSDMRLASWLSTTEKYQAVGGGNATLRTNGWSAGTPSVEMSAGALIRTNQMQGDTPFTLLFVYRLDDASGSRTLLGTGPAGVSIDITDSRVRLVKQFTVDLLAATVGNATGKHIITVRYDPAIGVSLRYDGKQIATLPAGRQGFGNHAMTLGRNTQAAKSADLVGAFGTFARCTSYLSDTLVARWEDYEKAQLGM